MPQELERRVVGQGCARSPEGAGKCPDRNVARAGGRRQTVRQIEKTRRQKLGLTVALAQAHGRLPRARTGTDFKAHNIRVGLKWRYERFWKRSLWHSDPL
jgi:hypothetical protein